MVHRIHLKGPWDYFPLNSGAGASADSALPASGTVKFPAKWQDVLGTFCGTVRFTRRFNQPTNLEVEDRVDLVFDGVGGHADVRLNDRKVGSISPTESAARFEISTDLQLHNLLEVTVTWSGPATEAGGLWAPVALEIIPFGRIPIPA